MLFDVPYRQLHSGMGPVESIRFDRGQFGVGSEGVVSPVGPQLPLDGVCQPGAAHNHPYPATLSLSCGGAEEGFRYLRFTLLGIVDGIRSL